MTGDLPVVCSYVEPLVKTVQSGTHHLPWSLCVHPSSAGQRFTDAHGGGAYLRMDCMPGAMGRTCSPSSLGTERGKIPSTQKLESRLCKKKNGKGKELTLHFASGSSNQNTLNFFFSKIH